ncbi:MAG TPA: XRE family transcriptional regulator [Mycobacteriales bacterium]|nr:XRE family transcriptional regulator [Mycobacteriales bacterium]
MTGTFNPEALIVARESRKKTQAQLADSVDISQGLISKFENGVLIPPAEQLARIAACLGYPLSFFFEPGALREGKSGCLYHRKRKTLPAKTLNEIDAKMAVRLLNTRRLLNGLEIDGERMFHTMDPDEFGSAAAVAQALRVAWRVPHGPIRNLVTLIESAGGVVLTAPFGTHKLFGMSQWSARDRPLFFLNADTAMEELRWTLAHELGHLTMHGVPTAEDLEAQADEFAAEFLTPKAQVLPDLRALSFARLPALKMHWRITMKALIYRAEATGAISRQQSVRLYKQYMARRWNNAEPYPLDAEEPTLITAAAAVHMNDHGYTGPELAEAVRLTYEEFYDEFLQQPRERRTGLSVVP